MTQYIGRCSPEVRIAEEVCSQFIYVKLGKLDKDAARQEVLTLLRLERELASNFEVILDHICDGLDVCSEDIHSHLDAIADEVLTNGEVNWGRIVLLRIFAARLAIKCDQSGNNSMIENIIDWLGSQVAKRCSWIRGSGRGWDGFVNQFSARRPIIDTSGWLHCFLAAAVFFGVLATIVLIKNG